MCEKSFFRKKFLQIRRACSWEDSARCIGTHVEKYFRQNPVEIVGFYYPIRNEIDLRPVLIELKKEGTIKTLALPRICGGRMSFVRWDEGDFLEKDESGVPSPISSSYVSPQCLLVPCLGIDREGYLLGYGAGWYDRFLADAAIETIGVLSEEFLLQSLPHEAHDRPLSGYVNENGLTFVKPLPSGNRRKNQ